ncbi:uncharacterized protein LOC142240457 [Haematobia irritans]|uniref:uncharacterized protein LOC142223361 n=1 Tax=Haematobia irritans TaxID=7368 RepID=UPI003F500C56
MAAGSTRKHKNLQQEDIFLQFMDENPNIAKGFVKGDRLHADEKWARLTASLNSAGPPVKDVNSWKKVWSDWKVNIRKKLAHNKRETSATGGGPYSQLAVSPVEDRIAQLCGLYKMIDGVEGTKSYGVFEDNVCETSPDSQKAVKKQLHFESDENASIRSPEYKPKRSRRSQPSVELEDLCTAQNEMMERVVDTLGEVHLVLREQNDIFRDIKNILQNKFGN